jgi:hypothetical protein
MALGMQPRKLAMLMVGCAFTGVSLGILGIAIAIGCTDPKAFESAGFFEAMALMALDQAF